MKKAFYVIATSVVLSSCNADSTGNKADNTTSLSAAKPVIYLDDQERLIAMFSPLNQGPLQLQNAYRVNLPGSYFWNIAPTISPDEQRYFAYHPSHGLWIDKVGADGEPKRLEGRVTNTSLGYADTIPFAWASNSRGIFGASQETAVPSGFALGPQSTLLIAANGKIRKLPQLKHPAGNLDGIMWVGGDGLAIAEFGTKGRYYRPEHEDKMPTIAMVDARRGLVIQSAPVPSKIYASNTRAKLPNLIGEIDAQLDLNGKIQSVFVMEGRRWFEWRQGESLRFLPFNTGNAPAKKFRVTPDFSKVLLMKSLSAGGMICERDPNCPPPIPGSGPIAELLDMKTGKKVWTIRGTATNFSNDIKPAISKDGRYALISMPANGKESQEIALISMRNGRIIQRISGPATSQSSVGFGKDGNAWISGLSFLATYRLNESSTP